VPAGPLGLVDGVALDAQELTGYEVDDIESRGRVVSVQELMILVLIFAVVVALVLAIVLGLRRVTGGGTGPTNVPSGQQPPSGYLVGRRQVESAGFCVGVASGPRLASSPGPVRTRRLTRRGGVHDSTRYGAVGCGRVRHRGPGRLRQGRRPLAFGLHGGDRHVGETGDPVRYVPFDPAR
jgi:hypothetical protein